MNLDLKKPDIIHLYVSARSEPKSFQIHFTFPNIINYGYSLRLYACSAEDRLGLRLPASKLVIVAFWCKVI